MCAKKYTPQKKRARLESSEAQRKSVFLRARPRTAHIRMTDQRDLRDTLDKLRRDVSPRAKHRQDRQSYEDTYRNRAQTGAKTFAGALKVSTHQKRGKRLCVHQALICRALTPTVQLCKRHWLSM